MPNSDDEATPAEVHPAYLTIFYEHLDDFRAHLAGRDGGDPLPASCFPPQAYWTAAEKDAFFRGLTVHSRLRPDLIAEEVKTKTIPDVCVYIAMLEEAEREMLKGAVDANYPNSARISRRDVPAALESSEDWVAFEERMADAVIASQPTLDSETVLREREEEVHFRRTTIRAKKGGARTASNERDREGEKGRREEFDKWLSEKRSDWEGEDFLLSLDRVGLTALDRMLREDEERNLVGDGSGYHSDAESMPPSEMLDAEETVEHGPDDAPMSSIDDELIDPLLLEISRAGSTVAAAPAPGLPILPNTISAVPSMPVPLVGSANAIVQSPTHSRVHSFQPIIPPFPPATLLALSDYQSLPPPLEIPALPARTDEGSLEDLSQMSPVSRRRHLKRLHMRRKRAQAAGTVANEDAERLRPGRKPKKRPPKALSSAASTEALRIEAETSSTASAQPEAQLPRHASVVDDSIAADPNQLGEEVAFRHPKISGKTLTYKRQVDFTSKGMDAQRLRREGLDLFHLQSVSKLMQTYNELHNVAPSIGSEISGETLRLLRGLVVQFIAEIMSRAIVWREQERMAKLQSKVWRLRENQIISAANVKHALVLYGADALDKRAHFARLQNKLDLDAGDDTLENEEEQVEAIVDSQSVKQGGDADDEQDRGDEAEGSSLKPLSLLRAIFPPFTNPSSSSLHPEQRFDSLDPSAYMPWPSSSLLSTATEPPQDEDILPLEIDENALSNELLDDAAIEKFDRQQDTEGMQVLWARVDVKSPIISAAAAGPEDRDIADDESGPSRTDGWPPRKRKRTVQDSSQEDGLAGESADAMENGDQGDGANGDTDIVEVVASKRPRRKRGSAYLSQNQLMYLEPDPNSRIKSSVYVLDSD